MKRVNPRPWKRLDNAIGWQKQYVVQSLWIQKVPKVGLMKCVVTKSSRVVMLLIYDNNPDTFSVFQDIGFAPLPPPQPEIP